jgi:uncharacterized protein (TIGR00369 family)
MTTSLQITPSPSARHLGWKLLESNAAGRVRIGFEPRPEFLNPAARIQGGFIAAMLDDCIGPAVWFRSGGQHFSLTIGMNVHFLRAAQLGPLVGEGQVLQLGKSIGFHRGSFVRCRGIAVGARDCKRAAGAGKSAPAVSNCSCRVVPCPLKPDDATMCARIAQIGHMSSTHRCPPARRSGGPIDGQQESCIDFRQSRQHLRLARKIAALQYLTQHGQAQRLEGRQ